MEYNWLGPDLTRNTRGQLYPFFGGFKYSDPVWYTTCTKVGIKLSAFCTEVIIICIYSAVFIFQVLSKYSGVILERREACSRCLYYGVIYDIMVYFRYDPYMGSLLELLTAGKRNF